MAHCMYIYTVNTVYNMYLCVAVPSTFSTIINFRIGGVVLGSEIRSARHTRLHVASADVRLVHKYFSSTKRRAAMLPVVTAMY